MNNIGTLMNEVRGVDYSNRHAVHAKMNNFYSIDVPHLVVANTIIDFLMLKPCINIF